MSKPQIVSLLIHVPVAFFCLFCAIYLRALKSGSAAGTLEAFNSALEAGVALRSNLLCGVLNACGTAGWMEDCMRVCDEMKCAQPCRLLALEWDETGDCLRGTVPL